MKRKKSRLSQAELQRKVEQFIKNGRKPEAQVVLVEAGYGPEALDEGQAKLDGWKSSKARRLSLKTQQKQATLAEKAAEEAAAFEIGTLRDTIWGLFQDDPALLSSLGLGPRRKAASANGNGTEAANGTAEPPTNGSEAEAEAETSEAQPTTAGDQSQSAKTETNETNGTTPTKRKRTGRVARLIEEWELCLGQVEALPETDQARLATKGWSATRLGKAGGLVQDVSQKDDDQQERVAEHHAQVKLCQQQEKDMRHWYALAGKLGRRAARRLPADQAAELRDLLGI